MPWSKRCSGTRSGKLSKAVVVLVGLSFVFVGWIAVLESANQLSSSAANALGALQPQCNYPVDHWKAQMMDYYGVNPQAGKTAEKTVEQLSYEDYQYYVQKHLYDDPRTRFSHWMNPWEDKTPVTPYVVWEYKDRPCPNCGNDK